MRRKTLLEQDGELSPDDYPNHFWQLVREGAQPCVNGFEGQHDLFKQGVTARRLPVAPLSSTTAIAYSQGPGVDHAGLFDVERQSNSSAALQATFPGRRTAVADDTPDTRNNSFHDSESEDIYDLYNACNGIVRDGLLDIRELDQFSQEEAEALNVERLKEIWAHTASGCSTCEEIIEILNKVRGSLKADLEDGFSGAIEKVNTKAN